MKIRNTHSSRIIFLLIVKLFLILSLTTTTAFGLEPKSIEANGVEITYVEQGEGPLMILAHGSISDHRRWIKDHIPLLAKNYRVVAYSMRYHGTSEWDESWPPLSMDLYADDLAALIQALDDGPAHVVGWSMGGMVAHRAALKYPELVRSAYLFEGAAALEKSVEQQAEHTKLRKALVGESMSLANDKKYVEAAGALLDAVIGKEGFFGSLPDGPQKAIGGKGKLLADYFETTSNPQVKYTCDEIKNSAVPTVFVTGDKTREFFAVALAEHYEPCFGEDRIVVVSDANHVWPGANFRDFVDSVKEFASEH